MRSTLLLLFVSLLAAPTPAADTSTPAADPHAADPQTWLRSLATQWAAGLSSNSLVRMTNSQPATPGSPPDAHASSAPAMVTDSALRPPPSSAVASAKAEQSALASAGLQPPLAAPEASPRRAPSALDASNAFSTMDTLDGKHKLVLGDLVSFRIVEDQEDPRETIDPRLALLPIPVTDSGDLEVPYIGRFPALGKTCKQLAGEIKVALEKKYYYQATVIIGLFQVTKSGGRVYLVGQLRTGGAVEIPGDEVFTLSKAILRAGGFTEFADKRHVKLTRKSGDAGAQTTNVTVDVSDILERGKTEGDLKLEPGDLIFVPSRTFNF